MKRINESDIDSMMRDFSHSVGGVGSPLLHLYALSAEVLGEFLGPEWVFNNVFGRAPLDASLEFGEEDSDDRYKHLDQVVSLAEMLFHFQSIAGVEKRVEDLRASTVEAGVGELEGAKLLYRSQVPFKFVIPSGTKGADFDVQIHLAGGPKVNCEMKCKLVETGLSTSTVLNTLKKSRGQLPSGEPAMIFLKIPEHWARTVLWVRSWRWLSKNSFATLAAWVRLLSTGKNGPFLETVRRREPCVIGVS